VPPRSAPLSKKAESAEATQHHELWRATALAAKKFTLNKGGMHETCLDEGKFLLAIVSEP